MLKRLLLTFGAFLFNTLIFSQTISYVSSDSQLEGNDITHSVSLTSAPILTASFPFYITDYTADAFQDFIPYASFSDGVSLNPLSGTIDVPAGVTSFDITIETVEDSIHEEDESYEISIGDASGLGTILDNDPTPTLSISGTTVIEGNDAVITINLSNPSSEDTVVDIATTDDTADSSDYTPVTESMTILAGSTSIDFSIATIDDIEDESDERFTVDGTVISGNTTNTDPSDTVTILDNDESTTTDTDGDGVTDTQEAIDMTDANDECDFETASITETVTNYCCAVYAPVFNFIYDEYICGYYRLNSILGTNLSGNEAYYTGSGGTGTVFSAGDVISTTTSLYVYDNNQGCVSEESFTITVHDLPTAVATVTGELTCAVTALTLDGTGSAANSSTGGLSYLWTTFVGTIDSGAATAYPVVSAPGTYTLTVTDTVTGCSDSTDVEVTEDVNDPTAIVRVWGELTCVVDPLTLDGTGSAANSRTGTLSYSWSTVDGSIDAGADTALPVVSDSGTYTLIVTDTYNGCTHSTDVVVTADFNYPTAIPTLTGELTCAVTILTLDGTGSIANSSSGTLNYSWSTIDGTIDSGADTAEPVVSDPGTYMLTVTDTYNGCTDSADVTITENCELPTETFSNIPVASGYYINKLFASPPLDVVNNTDDLINEYFEFYGVADQVIP